MTVRLQPDQLDDNAKTARQRRALRSAASAPLSAQQKEPSVDREWRSQSRTAASFDTNQRRLPDIEGSRADPIVGGLTKRWFDICVASLAIVLLLPLLCLIALGIKLLSPGAVLYRHRRVGANGVTFDCLKFRTMVVNGDEVLQRHLVNDPDAAREWAGERKLRNDPRVTWLGLSLRKTSVDELPQLINILRGEMSIVGPRPIVAAEVPKYADGLGHYFRARPGLTGLWQVSGRNDADYATRVNLDCHYVQNWSFWRDLAIIAATVRVVATSRGCY
jgi:exopolysaccharide production protein ExoY